MTCFPAALVAEPEKLQVATLTNMCSSDQPAKWVGLRVGHLAFTSWTSVLLAAVIVPLVVGHHHAMEKIIFASVVLDGSLGIFEMLLGVS